MKLRLRARLFLSYLFLLTITLTVVAFALVVFLFAQPTSTSDTYERLATITRDVIQQSGLGQDAQPTLREIRGLITQLPQIAQTNEIRILIINIDAQTVTFDTAGIFTRGATIPIKLETYTLPLYLRRSVGLRTEPLFGSLQNPDGAEWLFVGLANNRANAVLLADTRPPQTPESVLAKFQAELALPLCQSALVGLLIALILAGFISRSLTLALRHLAQIAAEAARGKTPNEIKLIGPPEVQSVAAAFNRMTAEVQHSRQSQQDFLINVSHDLKTPLTSIQGYSQAIMDGAAKDPTAAAKIIHEEAGRLNRMVTELTDLARLQAGRLSMRSEAIDMGKLTAAVGKRLTILAQEKNIALHVQANPMPAIAGDGDRLVQVLTNLVSNAIKYTPSGGKIDLNTQVNNGGVEVIVRDSGVGISEEDLPRVFERFYQVDKARGPQRGTGLGLAITQEIVAAHGGKITVTSAGLGQGTTFTIWLPSPQLSTIVRGRH